MLLLEHLFVSYPQIAQLKRLVIISSVPSAWSVLSLSVSLSASTSHAQQVLKQIVIASDSAYVCTISTPDLFVQLMDPPVQQRNRYYIPLVSYY